MNDKSQNHYWLVAIAMLAFASVMSPINVHIVVAQEAQEIVIAPADPGTPPTPPQAPAVPIEAPIAAPAEAASAADDVPAVDEPIPAVEPVKTLEVPITPSEVSSDTDIGKLLPKEEPLTPSVANAETKTDPESVRTLSVEPGARPMLPSDRPAWVGASPDFSSAQHFLYVGSLPTTKKSEADEALDVPLIAAVRDYIDHEVVNQLGAANSMPVTVEFIRRNLIDNPEGYECELTTGQEPLFQKWVTVRVTPEQRELFRRWHTEATQRTRLAPLGIGLVAVLSVISLSHVVLRRFRGANPLTMVNQHLPEQVVARKARKWSTSAKLVMFGLLMATMMFAFFLPLFALRKVHYEPPHVVDPFQRSFHAVEMPDLHNEVRIETLDGQDRTIILESKSRR